MISVVVFIDAAKPLPPSHLGHVSVFSSEFWPEKSKTEGTMLSQATIVAALSQLSGELGKRGVLGELNVVGGTAMVLAFNARDSTKDVDAIFEPSAEIRSAAAVVAESLALPPDWLNDAAKGFLSASGEFTPVATMDLPHLRVQAPSPEYMLAMKVMAARVGIAFLIRLLALTTSDAVMTIVARYYDPSRILPRSVYLVDQILAETAS